MYSPSDTQLFRSNISVYNKFLVILASKFTFFRQKRDVIQLLAFVCLFICLLQPMFGTHNHLAVRIFKRATPTVTRGIRL